MRRAKIDTLVSVSRLRLIQVLMGVLVLYLIFMSLEFPLMLQTGLGFGSVEEGFTESVDGQPIRFALGRESIDSVPKEASNIEPFRVSQRSFVRTPERRMHEYNQLSGLAFDDGAFGNNSSEDEFSELHNMARHAFMVGKKLWEETAAGKARLGLEKNKADNLSESCTHSISMSGDEFRERNQILVIPCGLTLGSHITVVGKPHWAHPENDPKIALVRGANESIMVSQFMLELQGLKTVEGEDPPRILHLNPRLKGDFSGRPVIEQNTCYRMQWGSALRCEGWKSMADEDMVDGQLKCEKWIRDDGDHSEESKTTWWLNRLIGRTAEVKVDWPYPFAEGKLFVLTLSAGLEGYHVNVDGRHVTSFPYRTGFTLEDATGLFIKGDVDVHSLFAASLPTSHPSFAPQGLLEMLTKWKAPPVPDGPVETFIGILSAGNHFGERMAVRKSWMQHPLIKSSKFVARFFVALRGRKEVNAEVMKEADFFGDIVIVPYMDNYDLVVLKTVAICEYGVRTVGAKYIMKCDDDTFVRIDAVMKEVENVRSSGSLYVGNINFYHRPLRYGKWAVSYEEWPEEVYPPYANGAGYVLSSDIARYIVSKFEENKLRLFKMEDVSIGMWVEQYNSSREVEYVHSLKFCQFGCIEDYHTAHYQSPRQMICLWHKLQHIGKGQCCNMR